MEMAKAALPPPKASSGRLYMFTLNDATAAIPSEIAAADHAGVGARGTAAVARAASAEIRQTRKRAPITVMPRCTNCLESQPPANPPASMKAGGIQAYQADCASVMLCLSTRYCVVQLV